MATKRKRPQAPKPSQSRRAKAHGVKPPSSKIRRGVRFGDDD